MALADARLVNLDTQEALFFQFHPKTLTETIAVDYGLELPIGGSRELSHYNGTRSNRIPLRLIYTEIGGLGAQAGAPFTRISTGQTRAAEVVNVDDNGNRSLRRDDSFGFQEFGPALQTISGAERFLKALCYGTPRTFAGDHEARGKRRLEPPARVLFIWPEILELEGEVERLRITFDRFDQETMRPLSLIAELSFREVSAEQIEAANVRRYGSTRRSNATLGMPPRQLPTDGGRKVEVSEQLSFS